MLHLPIDEIAKVIPAVVTHQRDQALFQALVESELAAATAVLGTQSLADLLSEAGLLDAARALTLRVIDPGAQALFASAGFGDFLTRLLAQAEQS